MATFPNGTLVTLTATPNSDGFGGWGGDAPSSCGTNLVCQIQITADANVIASFVPVPVYNLSVSGTGVTGANPGTGTVTSTPGGIDCGTQGQVCQFNFAQGTAVRCRQRPRILDPTSMAGAAIPRAWAQVLAF